VLADQLAAEGLSVEVTGPAGRLATIGAAADSALGRAVTGSRHVQPGRPSALRPLVLSQVRQGVRAAGRSWWCSPRWRSWPPVGAGLGG
jgi:hypothetical protein